MLLHGFPDSNVARKRMLICLGAWQHASSQRERERERHAGMVGMPVGMLTCRACQHAVGAHVDMPE